MYYTSTWCASPEAFRSDGFLARHVHNASVGLDAIGTNAVRLRQTEIEMNTPDPEQAATVVLLATPNTYRSQAFATAAEKLGMKVHWGVDLPEPLAEEWNVALPLDFRDSVKAVHRLTELAEYEPIAAVIALDDAATIIAARAAAQLGLAHNSPSAALAARDKLIMRERLRAGGVACPGFGAFPISADPLSIAARSRYPCVLKPLLLNGSRGVIRANNPVEFKNAWQRVSTLLRNSVGTRILVEDYIPGREVAVEALLGDNGLRVLAIFDKPDPLEGPFFEETIYVTPSRLSTDEQSAVLAVTRAAATALGLRFGPLHAELRLNEEGVWPIEVAGRSIGGLCSRTLRFGPDVSLEELILRQATGLATNSIASDRDSSGVMMIPIPARGILRQVTGVEAAEALLGIEDVEITAKLNYPLYPLPEGDGYLGFIFARADTPAKVEAALRCAHSLLHFEIDAEIAVGPAQ